MGLVPVQLSAALAYVQECCYFSTIKILICDIGLALEKFLLWYSCFPSSQAVSQQFFFTCDFFFYFKQKYGSFSHCNVNMWKLCALFPCGRQSWSLFVARLLEQLNALTLFMESRYSHNLLFIAPQERKKKIWGKGPF